MARSLVVRAVDVAALHAPRHKCSVGILDYEIGVSPCLLWIETKQALVASERLILPGSRRGDGLHDVFADDEVWTDDYADVVEFEPLTRVNAADFVNRTGCNDPETAVFVEVPPTAILCTNLDVERGRVSLARPLPTVARDHARFVVR